MLIHSLQSAKDVRFTSDRQKSIIIVSHSVYLQLHDQINSYLNLSFKPPATIRKDDTVSQT